MFNRWLDLKLQKNPLLIGPRRAGKTTYLLSSFQDHKYITLDDLDYWNWANRDPKGLVQSLGPKAIIDEVQRVPILTVAVKHLIDQKKLNVIMTGSSSIGLLDSSADSLAGRINIIHFPTACWGENEGAPSHSFFNDELSQFDLTDANRKLDEAIKFGGFPEVLTQQSDLEKKSILKIYRNTYFTRDLAQLSNIENIEGLLAILHQLVRSIGSHLEVSSFAQESGLSHPTAKKYLNVLAQSDLSFKLYGYQFGPAKRYLKASKMYFCDNGIFTALGQEISKGQLVENFVISELEKRRKLGFIKADQFYYYKSSSSAEIDLIFEENDSVYAVEIKSSTTISPKDIRNLRDYMPQPKHKRKIRKFLVYLGMEYKEIEGIRCIPIAALYRAK